MDVFGHYSRYYDLLYRDKDYVGEAAYVAKNIREHFPNVKTILELGCGTGAHAEHLVRLGFNVHGIDLSDEMLTCAKARKSSLPECIADALSFSKGDVRNVRTGKTYDVVVSLFHVMSYQTSNADLEDAFVTASLHLNPGGLFLFDYWYGPAVLTQRPEVRVKRIQDDKIKVTRIAESETLVNENSVNVNYTVFIEDKESGKVGQLKETHRMRYLFMPELNFLLAKNGFNIIVSKQWMTDFDLTDSSWNGFVVASK